MTSLPKPPPASPTRTPENLPTIPGPGERWQCPKCWNNGTNYGVQHNASSETMTLMCNRCGYFEWRSPLDRLPV